ncbi:helix-turn-helix domain-containing protein [Noviherbaspirillum aridicola]|uniref:Helix-turn-helix domain-containing protein n=1 Tax=Noviherbaspirillum aridicola TaxID=2849687 RepID=A0ABQ4QAF7_9BURK|nr:helix-turn-helix domain-containing protein [Noviherbaspirillum aridicola]GIZ54062.1 hypothetical protein NCCP691_40760 [Noviherbaspirillum aridicola]
MTVQTQSKLVPPGEAAEILETTIQTLANWRNTGRYALPYVKIGRLVRYRMSDLEAFIEARTIAPCAAKE